MPTTPKNLNDCHGHSLQLSPDALGLAPSAPRLNAADVHTRHGEFVWKSLHRLGMRSPHIDDVYQEVFLVVHRRLDSFTGHCPLTAWLFEVCFRVVAGYRRRAYFRRELPVADAGKVSVTVASPERDVERREAAEQLQGILSELKLEQRVVFTMFELEGLSCVEISALFGVPLGTVYSRLHRARGAFSRALARQKKQNRACCSS